MRPWNDCVTFLSYVAIHIHLDMLKPKKITSWMVGVGYKIKYLSLLELQEVVLEIPPVKWTNTLRPSHIIRFHQQCLLQR